MTRFLALFLFISISLTPLHSMDLPPKEQAPSKLSTSQIDFNSLINPAEKERIEIHFFWTTGRPYNLLKEEYGADRVVNMGGTKWAEKFNSYIIDFLYCTPECVTVVFVCDRLTSESNAPLFNLLSSKFDNRFQLTLWETLTTKIYEKLPQHATTLKLFFDQGFYGNPAIASDVNRLIGIPLVCDDTGIPFDKTMWTYTDVDTFCYALEHEKIDDYLTALLKTQLGSFSYKARGKNDVVKFGFKDREIYNDHVGKVVKKLIKNYTFRLENRDIHVMNYLKILFSFVEKNDFKGYIDKYKDDVDEGVERGIIYLTGPGFTNKLKMSQLYYPSTSSLEWNPMAYYTNSLTGYLDHLYYLNYFGDEHYTIQNHIGNLFDKYLPHLRRAMATKRFGPLHPFNVDLLTWLRENNPYMSKEYKRIIKTLINQYPWDDTEPWNAESLKKRILKIESGWANKIQHHNIRMPQSPPFFRIREALRSVGIDFPVVPVDD